MRTTLAVTCPMRTADFSIGSERNRSIAPVVMSAATGTAVPAAPYPAQSSTMPGTTYVR